MIGISWKLGPPRREICVSTYEWMRPASSGSLVKSMPGTTCAVQNATCSVSAKKLSGLRLRTMRPTGVTGTSSSGTSFVGSSTSKLEVPVALVRVELHGKPPHVAGGVLGSALARHGGKAHEDGRDLLAQDEILEQGGPAQPGLERMLVVGDEHALVGGERLACGVDPKPVERADGQVVAGGRGPPRLAGRIRLGQGTGTDEVRWRCRVLSLQRHGRVFTSVLGRLVGVERQRCHRRIGIVELPRLLAGQGLSRTDFRW